ncbi:hypothetical protein, partial [Klebsiella aerogenes]|uniref:hypothetical protein n=1 Tax=Klebsiella aerogenes TaxID=548 RepID=UPI001954ABF7
SRPPETSAQFQWIFAIEPLARMPRRLSGEGHDPRAASPAHFLRANQFPLHLKMLYAFLP